MTSALVSYAPTNLAELEDWAKRYANAFQGAYRGKPQDVVLAVMWGAEAGLKTLQSLQAIAVINGKPAFYGDWLVGLAEKYGKIKSRREGFLGTPYEDDFRAWCECTTPGGDTFRQEFSVADAKLAKLWNKRGHNGQDTPWVTHPKRMLQMRARNFAVRDAAPDLGLGPSAEEMREIEDEEARANRAKDVTPPRQHADGTAFSPIEEVDAANAEAAEPERVARADAELARDPLGINGSGARTAIGTLTAGFASARTAADAEALYEAYRARIARLPKDKQDELAAIVAKRIEDEAEARRLKAREAFKEGAARGAAHEARGESEEFADILADEGELIGPDE